MRIRVSHHCLCQLISINHGMERRDPKANETSKQRAHQKSDLLLLHGGLLGPLQSGLVHLRLQFLGDQVLEKDKSLTSDSDSGNLVVDGLGDRSEVRPGVVDGLLAKHPLRPSASNPQASKLMSDPYPAGKGSSFNRFFFPIPHPHSFPPPTPGGLFPHLPAAVEELLGPSETLHDGLQVLLLLYGLGGLGVVGGLGDVLGVLGVLGGRLSLGGQLEAGLPVLRRLLHHRGLEKKRHQWKAFGDGELRSTHDRVPAKAQETGLSSCNIKASMHCLSRCAFEDSNSPSDLVISFYGVESIPIFQSLQSSLVNPSLSISLSTYGPIDVLDRPLVASELGGGLLEDGLLLLLGDGGDEVGELLLDDGLLLVQLLQRTPLETGMEDGWDWRHFCERSTTNDLEADVGRSWGSVSIRFIL